jgi:hypothetical protein
VIFLFHRIHLDTEGLLTELDGVGVSSSKARSLPVERGLCCAVLRCARPRDLIGLPIPGKEEGLGVRLVATVGERN